MLPEFRATLRADERVEAAKEESCARLESYIEESRKEWSVRVDELLGLLRGAKLSDGASSMEKLIEAEALSLSYRHMAVEEVNAFLVRLAKRYAKKADATRDRHMFYSLKCELSVKTKGERDMHVEADLAQDQRWIQLAEAYVDFLRECRSECDHVRFVIKNKIEVTKLVG